MRSKSTGNSSTRCPTQGFWRRLRNQDRGLGAQIAALALIGYGVWKVFGATLSRLRKSSKPAETAGAQPLPENGNLPGSHVVAELAVSPGHSWPELKTRALVQSTSADHPIGGQRSRGRRRHERASR